MTRWFLGIALLLGANISAGCSGSGSSGDPASKNHLQFTRIEGEEETLLGVSLDGCYEDKTGCYTVSRIGGPSNKGELSVAQLDSVRALVTDDLQEEYAKDADPECDATPELRYVLSYDDEDGGSTMWCFSADDDLSSETQNTLDELTALAELLLQE